MGYQARLTIAVATGSALGGSLRYLFGLAAVGVPTPSWLAVVTVNAVGCGLMGWYGAASLRSARFGTGIVARHFVMTGILGGFTSFSLFSLTTLQLLRDAAWVAALASMMATALLCLGAIVCGYRLGHSK